jgi:hypothetical protein
MPGLPYPDVQMNGHNYDFVANGTCVGWKNVIGLHLYKDADRTYAPSYGDPAFALDWLAKAGAPRMTNGTR